MDKLSEFVNKQYAEIARSNKLKKYRSRRELIWLGSCVAAPSMGWKQGGNQRRCEGQRALPSKLAHSPTAPTLIGAASDALHRLHAELFVAPRRHPLRRRCPSYAVVDGGYLTDEGLRIRIGSALRSELLLIEAV